MTIYLVTARGTVHKAIQGDTQLLTDERDNIDDAKVARYTEWNAAKAAAKRWCRHCFATGPVG
jgi:hypothetical protein